MNRFTIFLFSALFAGFGLTGCMVSGGIMIEPEPIIIGNPPPKQVKQPKSHNYRHHKKRGSIRIPPGHMPPPGQCRIWFDNRPPGHQPPPGNCRALSRRVPYNAFLIVG